MTASDSIKAFLADPRVQAARAAIEPALPILLRMATEQAQAVLAGLAGADSEQSLLALRREATEAEWQAVTAGLVSSGKLAALQAVQDRDALVKLAWGIVLDAARSVLP